MRKPDLTEEKKEAARLFVAQGMRDKAAVARQLGRNRSTVFTWFKEWEFQQYLASITAAPEKDARAGELRDDAMGGAREAGRLAREAVSRDAEEARRYAECGSAFLKLAREAEALGGLAQGARPADVQAASLAAESQARVKAMLKRLRKANGAGAES